MSTHYVPPKAAPAGPPPPPPRVTAQSTGPQASTGDPSFGTQIQVMTSGVGIAPETFETIEGVGDIDGPSMSIAETETTSHSTGVPVRTFIPSLIDPGTLSFPCFFNPDDPTHSLASPYGLEHLFYGRTVTKWRLINTNSGQRTREFWGFVRELGESYPVEGVNTRDTTIRISGTMTDVMPEVTLAPATATPAAAGGPATITVTLAGTGTWMPTTSDSWITIQSPTAAQSVSGSVNYTVANNASGAERIGTIKVAGKDFVITQALA